MQNGFDSTYGNEYGGLEPYMLYGDRSARYAPEQRGQELVRDLEYLQGMYPANVKRIQEYVVRACDKLDYPNSPMYDEYPDRLLVNQLCDGVCRRIGEDGKLSAWDFEGFGEVRKTEQEEEQAEPAAEETVEEVKEADREVSEAQTFTAQETGWTMQQIPPFDGYFAGGPGPAMMPRPPQPPRPPQGPPPWGPPPGPRPPQPPRPPQGPPPWGPPPGPRPPQNPPGNWTSDLVWVLLLNEMHRRRCRSGMCR